MIAIENIYLFLNYMKKCDDNKLIAYLSRYFKHEQSKFLVIQGASLLMGILAFVLIYGVKVINPFCIDFLRVEGDPGQHYYGWELYRISDWFVKPGLFNYASYPYSVSVIFTDSIPLMAVLTKWFINGASVRIQYFGIWELICFALQGYFAAKLIKTKTDKGIVVFWGSVLFILSPCMLRRVFWHSALSAHFLILIALLLYEKAKKNSLIKNAVCWGILGILCASIHLYFVAICGIILGGFCIKVLEEGKKGLLKAAVSAGAFCTMSYLVIYLLGGTVSGMDNGAPGVGYYGLNLKSFIQPDDGWSQFIPNIEYFEGGQYEGFVYLGLGVLILLIIAALLEVYTKWSCVAKQSLFEVLSELAIVIVTLIVSTGNIVCFGKVKLFDYYLGADIEGLLSIVRANGRVAWILVYLILLSVLTKLSQMNFHKGVLLTILICAVGLNIVDLYPRLAEKNKEYTNITEYENSMEIVQRFIDSSPFEYKHIVLLEKDDLNQKQLYDLADIAIENKLTLNDFYFARSFNGNVNELAVKSAKEKKADSIYILPKKDIHYTFRYDLNWLDEGDIYIGYCGW